MALTGTVLADSSIFQTLGCNPLVGWEMNSGIVTSIPYNNEPEYNRTGRVRVYHM